jgi:hypothetical protein
MAHSIVSLPRGCSLSFFDLYQRILLSRPKYHFHVGTVIGTAIDALFVGQPLVLWFSQRNALIFVMLILLLLFIGISIGLGLTLALTLTTRQGSIPDGRGNSWSFVGCDFCCCVFLFLFLLLLLQCVPLSSNPAGIHRCPILHAVRVDMILSSFEYDCR